MKEKIYLCSKLNESEICRTLARNKKNTMGIHIMDATELSDYILKKNGIFYSEKILIRKEEPFIIYSFLKSVEYFKDASYQDAENISSTLFEARLLIPNNEKASFEKVLEESAFKKRKKGLIEVYNLYSGYKKSNNYIDSIDIIRKMLSEKVDINFELAYFKEYPLNSLELEIVKKFSSISNVESLCDFFGVKDLNLNYDRIYEAYGASNEVEKILSEIIESKDNYDDAMIVVSNVEKYVDLLLDYSNRYNIPMSFGTGVSIMNSNPGKLLKAMYSWKKKGYCGHDATVELLNSDSLNRKKLKEDVFNETNSKHSLTKIAELVGNLKIDFNSKVNQTKLIDFKDAVDARETMNDKEKEALISYVNNLAKILENGYLDFVKKYSYIRKDKRLGAIDKAGLDVIEKFLNNSATYIHSEDEIERTLPKLFGQYILVEASNADSIHVSTISSSINSIRKNVYIMGLNSSNFPGKPTENYLLLDSEYNEFGSDLGDILPTSKNKIEKKIKELDSLISISKGYKSNVVLSFSNYDFIELKEDNPSSYLFNIYQLNNQNESFDDFKDSLIHISSFDGKLSKLRNIGKAYIEEFDIINNEKEVNIPDFDYNRTWSPSAIEKYLECEREFFFKYILNVEDKEEDDPFEILPATEKGNLAHTLMGYLAKNPKISKENFLKESEIAFKNFLKLRCPISQNANKEKDNFIKMMDIAYDMNIGKNEIRTEEHLTGTIDGLEFGGYCDRIEQENDGTYVIVDFKTGNTIKHIENDIISCIQVAIYAYLFKLANPNEKVRCEYRYLAKGEIVRFDCNDLGNKLNAVLDEFKKSFVNKEFDTTNEEKNDCGISYCKYKGLCNKTKNDLKGILG